MSEVKRVLIIDSDPDFLDAARGILEAESIHVRQASSTSEGLLLAESEPPDAIVLEVMVPEGTEGFHFTWNLRQHQDARLCDVPILIVSRINQTVPFRLSLGDHDWEYGPGEFLPAQGFVDKPVQLEDLRARVREVLGLA